MTAHVFINENTFDINIFMSDGGVASIYDNEEGYVADYYQNRIPLDRLPEDMSTANKIFNDSDIWEELGEGKMYWDSWKVEEAILDEMIQEAVNWLCVGCNTEIIKYYENF